LTIEILGIVFLLETLAKSLILSFLKKIVILLTIPKDLFLFIQFKKYIFTRKIEPSLEIDHKSFIVILLEHEFFVWLLS
jgi:hypothetical protein